MNKRSKILLGLLLVLFLVLGWMLWQNSQGGGQTGAQLSPIEENLTNRLEQLEAIDFGLEVLDSENFQNLQQYGKLPIQIDASGRINPFQSF